MTILVLSVWFLAVARLTRLINADSILDRPRLAIIARKREAVWLATEAARLGQDKRAEIMLRVEQRWSKAAYFVQCPWCVGMWMSLLTCWAPMVLLSWFGRPWYLDVVVYLGLTLACSHLVGVCARFADTEEIDVEDLDDAQ